MAVDKLHTYLIEPKAPLVIRSGRPFDGQAGADEARFPPPSTLAGALRTAHAETAGLPLSSELAKIPVAGPLAVRLGEVPKLLVPKPADALYFWSEDRSAVRLVRAAPRKLADGEGCDLPSDDLLPVQLTEPITGKPAPGPRWWAFDDLLKWRSTVLAAPTFEAVSNNGWSPLTEEIRTHVAIKRKSQAAESGKLFQTAGLVFDLAARDGQPFPEGRIGIVGRIAGKINAGVITLGGERRLSSIAAAPADLWPPMPRNLPAEIRKAGGLSLTLLTPALFNTGWRPPELPGLRLRAAALERWQAHSGWNLAADKHLEANRPRAGRKLVPAGAVYWYALLPDISDEKLAAFWLAPLGDCEQDCRDGFGLVLPQPWQFAVTSN